MIICIINQESYHERQVRDFIYCGDQWKIIHRHLRRAVISHQVGGGVGERGAELPVRALLLAHHQISDNKLICAPNKPGYALVTAVTDCAAPTVRLIHSKHSETFVGTRQGSGDG